MTRCTSFAIVGVTALVTLGATVAFTQNTKDTGKDAGKGAAATLPPGMTQEEMNACTAAGTPGPMQQHLVDGAGLWTGTNTMWMVPGTPPLVTECSSTVTPIMDGRFTKCEMKGDMGAMGQFNGLGVYGYDNVTQKFQATWLDNMATGMMTGTGTLGADGTTMTWVYNYTCPITKKPVVMREIQRHTGTDTMTMEMWGPYYKTGQDYKMMEISLTRKAMAPAATKAAPATKSTR